MIHLVTSHADYGLKLRMDEFPQSFLDLPPGAKLLYIYLLGRQEASWSHDKLERSLGAKAKNILAHANTLDELGLIKYTHGFGTLAPADTAPKLEVTKKVMSLGRLREVPDILLGERTLVKLVWIYLARSGLTLTTPELKSTLGLSWLATYTALKDLNQSGLVKTTGKKPLKHKAVETS